MGTITTIFRIFVVSINIIFLISGLGYFILGMFIRFGNEYITDRLDNHETDIETSLNDGGFGTINLDIDVYVFFVVALCFICLGVIVMVVTAFGCCASCYKIKCLLVIYIIVSILLLLGQVATVVIVYRFPNTMKDPIKTRLKEDIQSDYMGINGTNSVSTTWNIVMQEIGCCGVDSYNDFTGAQQWVTDYTGNTPSVTLKTPICCCRVLPVSDDFTCAGSSTTSTDNYMDTGCFDKLWDKVFDRTLTIVLLAVCGGIQLMLIVLSILILCSWRNENKAKVKPTSRTQKQKPAHNVKKREQQVNYRDERKRKGYTRRGRLVVG
ncbi:hypothetical protein ACF0H5_012572 [Mactra antiquata]